MKPTIVQLCSRRGLGSLLCAGLFAASSGCHCWGWHKGSATLPPPLGTSINQAVDIQALNAAADDFVIYHNQWLGDSAVLGPAGKRDLERMIKKLPQSPCPIMLEPTGQLDLDRARQDAIVSVLAMREIPDAAQRVTIGDPTAEPLNGDEAERIYEDRKDPDQGMGYGGGYGYGGYGGYGGGIGGDAWSRHIGSGSWWGGRGSGSYGGGSGSFGRRGFWR